MNQDGNSYLGNTLDNRDVAITCTVVANAQEELIIYRKQMQEVFNPKLGEGYLIYKDNLKEYKLKCVANKIPTIGETIGLTQTFLISLTATFPYWQQLEELKKEIALWKGSFEFPLEILEEGIEMGYREPSLIVNILNKGDVSCGMKIEFKSLATVVNPSLFNINTREYFKINRAMEAGEMITATTHFQNKRVELNKNGITINAFNWIDLNSIFLQLDVGDNLLRYNADQGLDNLEVSICYTPQYLGV